MPDISELSPTRSAYLELKDERDMIQEGYEFLDEKRMIVAAEMLRQLKAYQEAAGEYDDLNKEALASLASAAARHGLEDLNVYPARKLTHWQQSMTASRFLGVELISPGDTHLECDRPAPPVVPSIEAETCRSTFETLAEAAARVAIRMANLRRLIAEYIRTERRARALENVLLPEIDQAVTFMEEQLEAVDQEEALRVRFADSTH